MPQWLEEVLERSSVFMPHGHCYLWLPSLLWLHVVSDLLIGIAYLGISLLLYLLVRRIRLPFSPVFVAFGLFIGLCGLTHFMSVWTVWNPDYLLSGVLKAATAAASVATAVGLVFVRPRIEAVVHTARLSEERRIKLESAHAELETLYRTIKEVDEHKSHFFANVSHELRTPLALILGPAERMLRDTNLQEDQKRQLDLIVRNSKGLLKQVNDLLDVAKLEAGKMTPQYVRLDLAPWFRRIASQFEIAASQRNFLYSVSAPDSLVAEVDAEMLERVLTNLLSNAFKFTPSGGEIKLALHDAAGQEFRFSISDTGIGIHPDQQQLIFERFRQADSGTTREHEGTGLGLAIVKDFVELHGGRVQVASTLGRGAAFDVYLPVRAPASAVVGEFLDTHPAATNALNLPIRDSDTAERLVSTEAPADGSPGKPSVLVVEDNPDMRSFIADTLGDQYNVITAMDGEDGLTQACALHPDLVITDIMMPRMSGDRLVGELRKRVEFETVPIVLLTAKADDALKVGLLRSGAQDYLTKPFSAEELLARCANLVAIKRSGDALRETLASASTDVQSMAAELSLRHRQLQIALETAHVAQEQAQRATEVKTQFLALVSHELRTPVSIIQVNTEVIGRLAAEKVPEWFGGVLERLKRATLQMSTLIEGLLEYIRVESGTVAYARESVDTLAIAKELVDAHRDLAPTDVQLALAAPDHALLPFVSDTRLVRVVLSNLLSNAIKFTKRGTVTVRVETAGTWQVLEVQDTGIGIPEADIERIFLPFEQLEPIKRKSIPGVGLGLALVNQIVEMLGGSIEVRSNPGEGSTFRVLLPRSGLRSIEGEPRLESPHAV